MQVLLLDQVGKLPYSMALVMVGSRACQTSPLEYLCLALDKVGLGRSIAKQCLSTFINVYQYLFSTFLCYAAG